MGVILVATHLIVAIGASFLAPADPTAIDASSTFAAPSVEHLMGTDQFGRDVLSRVLHGGRIALVVALAAAFLSVTVGGAIGIMLAVRGGAVDEVFMRITDGFLAVPAILGVLVIATGLGTSVPVLMLAIAVLYTPSVVRVARGAALHIVPLEFIQSARSRGEGTTSIIFREILPNTSDVLLVELALRASGAVLLISTLSFLGFGVAPPTPDWGLMIAENRNAMTLAPWVTLGPIVAVSTLIIGLNLTSDGVAKALGLDNLTSAPE